METFLKNTESVVVIWGYSQGEHKLMSNKDKRKDIPSGPGDADGGEAGFEEKINTAMDRITQDLSLIHI